MVAHLFHIIAHLREKIKDNPFPLLPKLPKYDIIKQNTEKHYVRTQ